MASLDDLHRHAAGGGVVGEAHQQLGDATVSQRLSGRGAVTLGHGRQAVLRVQILGGGDEKTTHSEEKEEKQLNLKL